VAAVNSFTANVRLQRRRDFLLAYSIQRIFPRIAERNFGVDDSVNDFGVPLASAAISRIFRVEV